MKEYTVTIGGVPHTVRLNDEDAKRLGAKQAEAAPSGKAKQPPNKSRSTSDK